MIDVKEVKYFIKNSTSNSFVTRCTDNRDWVIRLKKQGKNSKRLFSEYVAGTLAQEFGISRPPVSLVRLSKSNYSKVNSKEKLFDDKCNIGVGSKYIKGLDDIGMPQTKSFLNKDFSEINRKFILKILEGSPNFEQIFGLKVFSHWIYLSDYHKYENLKVNRDKQIYFLDFDLAFSSNNGEWEELQPYDWINIQTDQASFWEGFTYEIEPFENWFTKLLQLDLHRIILNLGRIPDCWGVPENYLIDTLKFIFSNRNNFIEEFRHAIDFKKQSKYGFEKY